MSIEILREKLHAIAGTVLQDGDVMKLLSEVCQCGGGISLDLEEGRWKLIRREGRFMLRKEDMPKRPSTLPPRR